jgi:phospholipid-translocating ATPase
LRGTYHNHNLTKAKSRSIGVPAFIRNFFKRQSFADESGEEEFDREQRKRGFWGKRRIRRPTLAKGSGGDGPSEVPRDAPGGGNVQGGKKAAAAAAATGNGNEARAPQMHERLEGDHYADEDLEDDTSDQKQQHHGHGPHIPFAGHHYEHAVWKRESWEDLQVGDFVRLRGDESVPAGEA